MAYKKGYKKYKKYYKSAKSDYNKLMAVKAKEKKSATRKEVGDKNAINTLIQRQPVFTKASQLIKNMAYYEANIGLSATASTPQVTFKANDMHDPYDPSGGHQPIGHDQMMAFYEHFCVIRSNATVTFSNPSTQSTFRVGIMLAPDTSAQDQIGMIENGLCKTVVLSPRGNSGSVKSISLNCDVKNYFGRESYRDMMSDERLTGTAGTSPTELVHYGVFVIPAFEVETIDVLIDVAINYDVIYYEPKKIPRS